MWAKRETLTVIRIAGMHCTHSLRRGVRTLKWDTQGMLRQWPQHLNLNRSLETLLTRLSRTNERSEKSRRVFKKPRCYKDESDGCIDTWIEVMKLHFEEEDLSERQECSALTSNLEGTALNCVMAKKQYQRDTAEKFFEILFNRFGSGVQGHQAMMRFEKRRQREDETIDKFLDDLEMLRRRSQPDESNRKVEPGRSL